MFCPCGPRAAQTGGPPRRLSALRCTRSKTLHSPYEDRSSSARAAERAAKTVLLAPFAGGAPPRGISHQSPCVKTRAQRPWIACRNGHSDEYGTKPALLAEMRPCRGCSAKNRRWERSARCFFRGEVFGSNTGSAPSDTPWKRTRDAKRQQDAVFDTFRRARFGGRLSDQNFLEEKRPECLGNAHQNGRRCRNGTERATSADTAVPWISSAKKSEMKSPTRAFRRCKPRSCALRACCCAGPGTAAEQFRNKSSLTKASIYSFLQTCRRHPKPLRTTRCAKRRSAEVTLRATLHAIENAAQPL